jgi:hypothetical protein
MPSPARSLTLALVAVSTSALPLQPQVLPSSSRNVARTAGVDMGRKGRPKMPGGAGMGMMPGGQMGQGPKGPPEDGSSLFYLYCRAERKDLWYPVSVMKGDGSSQGLIGAWLNSPFAKQVFKDRLDEGMARSIFESERQLADMAVRTHPNLQKFKTRLGWGYKIVNQEIAAKEATGEMEKMKVVPVFKDMVKPGLLDDLRKKIGV